MFMDRTIISPLVQWGEMTENGVLEAACTQRSKVRK